MFESLEDIMNYCNGARMCIISENHNRSLVKKTSDNSYQIYEDVKTRQGHKITAIEHFITQLNNNLVNPGVTFTDIIDCIPVINMDIIQKYDKRQIEIEQYQKIMDDLNNSKFKLFGKSNNLVYGTKYMLNNQTGKYDYINAYFNIIDNELVFIDERQLSDKDKKKALNIEAVEKALKDSLINEYSEFYNEQCRKWNNLK